METRTSDEPKVFQITLTLDPAICPLPLTKGTSHLPQAPLPLRLSQRGNLSSQTP